MVTYLYCIRQNLKDKRTDCQNCSVLYCVQQLCSHKQAVLMSAANLIERQAFST